MTRILVTGSAGWIGTQLCQHLEERGFEVWRFDRMVHSRYMPHKDRMVYGDITNLDSCKRAMHESLPHIVVHLAAVATTDKWMYDHPNEMITVTFNGTINVANAFASWAKETNSYPNQFVYASSSEVYGAATPPPFTEETQVHPCNVYSYSKYAGELFLREEWGKTNNIPFTILRNFNTYGNLSYQRTLIDHCVKEMLAGKSPVKLGNPDAVRDWEFVDDHVNAYLTVIGNPKAFNETFNFCRGEPYTIKDTVDRIIDATNYTGEVKWGTGFQRKNDVPLLHGDPNKANRVLGWEAKYSLHDGLTEYVSRLGNLARKNNAAQPAD